MRRVEMVVTIGCDWSRCAAVITIRSEQTMRGVHSLLRSKGWTASYGHYDTTGKGMYYRCPAHCYEVLHAKPRPAPIPVTDPRSHQKQHKARPVSDDVLVCADCGWPVHLTAGARGWRHTAFHGTSYKAPERKRVAA